MAWIDGEKLDRCGDCGGALSQREYDLQFHAECPKKPQSGPLWFAIENQHGHLSAVYEVRGFTAQALALREDRDKCKMIRVRVIKEE